MKRRLPEWTTVALAIAVPVWLAAAPAAAQSKGGTATSGATSSGGGQSSGGGSHASSGGSSGGGGGHASGGGGVSSGGGSHVSGGGSSSGGRTSSGGGSNGSNGSATSRGAVQRGPGSSPTSANGSTRTGAASNDSATPRGSARTNDANGVGGNVPPNARPRNGQPSLGTAVPRTATTPILGQGNVFVPGLYGYYPYGYGGLGFIGGYYGGYYGDFAGGYGGGYDDQYDQGYQSAPGRSDEAGGLKLKIRPAEGAVYVDGYYVGVVGDFDGVFQKLTIEPGTHRVEVRANGYETLTFEVRIEDGHTTTYRGEMKKLP